jgi:hypothetical protein
MESAPELVSLVELMLRNWGELDANALVDTLSHHPGFLAIGTDPDEWWEGFDNVSAVWRVQMQEFDDIGAVHFKVKKIVGWKEGTVGWVSSILQLTVGETVDFPMRFTVVLHEEGAYWRIVNWHLSVPVVNEDLFGSPLTTAVDEILTMVQGDAPPLSAMASDGSITIVFTDIEGSVALMESLGEQRWLELLGWHNGIIQQQIAVFGQCREEPRRRIHVGLSRRRCGCRLRGSNATLPMFGVGRRARLRANGCAFRQCHS